MTETADTGRTDGRSFELLELIGQGAFGEVYLAEQVSSGGFKRKVALKLLNQDVQKMREAGVRLRDEAKILGKLAHRHIVAVLDLVKVDERWAVIMDYVPGADLEHVVEALNRRDEAFPVAAALEAGSAVLSALDAAFNAQNDDGSRLEVIHRDIKPSNVRVTSAGEIKVLDFGVARFSLDTREAKTRATGWMGTERYMSPERILCEGDTSGGDVYAATATVVEMLLGRPLGRTPVLEERHVPFVAEALTEIETVIEGDEETKAEIVAALQSGLATTPEERPTAAALSDTFEALARKVSGESLNRFARRFVPQVSEILGVAPKAASGTLKERSGASALDVTQPASPTVWVPESGTGVTDVRSSSGPPTMLIVAALALVVLLLVGGLGFFGVAGFAYLGLADGSDVTAEPAPVPAQPEPIPVAPEPEPEPDAVAEAPEPEPEPEPQPAKAKVAPKPTPKPVEPEPEPEPSAPMASGPPIDRAQVSLRDASSLTVTCGAVSASGTASVRITNFPSGTCRVQAVYLGKNYTADLRMDAPRGFKCTIAGDTLKCS